MLAGGTYRALRVGCRSASVGPRHFLESPRSRLDIIRLGKKAPAIRQVLRGDLGTAGDDDQLDRGQRSRTACASRSPSIDPGIWTSVNTRRTQSCPTPLLEVFAQVWGFSE